MNKLFALIICLLIAGCTPFQAATMPPSPQPIKVVYSPSFEFFENAIHECANHHQELALLVEVKPASLINVEDYDLSIWWGDDPGNAPFAYPLVKDGLVFLLNNENSNNNLSTNELRALYSGSVQNWDEISTFQAPVAVWVYPEQNELQRNLEKILIGSLRISSLAYQAPDPEALLEAVSREPGAIGFIPRSWLNDAVNIIEIEQGLENELLKPLLGLTNLEPQGGSLILLDCLQNGVGQRILLNHYSPLN